MVSTTKKLFLFLIIYSTVIFAQDLEEQIWQISYVDHHFVHLKKQDLLIVKSCIDKKNGISIRQKCQEKLNIVKSNSEKLPSLKGGKNPGAVICRQLLNANVLFAKDKKGNVRTFCNLGDDIIIDNYWVMVNHGKSYAQ